MPTRKISNLSVVAFSTAALFIKLIWLSSLPGRGLLGADGENYLEALNGLLEGGIFSQHGKLLYWPAGYPILMWPIAELSVTNFPFLIGTLQSILFTIAIILFILELSRTNMAIFCWPVMVILTFNPTLSLNSVVIGYEVPVASLLLISITLLIRHARQENKQSKFISMEIYLASVSLAISCFMQPRILFIAAGTILVYVILTRSKKRALVFLVVTLVIISVAPLALVARNLKANNLPAISTNLGVTMNIGAGPGASGGYTINTIGVPCDAIKGDAVKQDRHLVSCVIRWNWENPSQAAKLMARKFVYHWSPWLGPIANGTMARNPWRDIYPLNGFFNSPDGVLFVNGLIGKFVSWAWLIGSLVLIAIGFYSLHRMAGIARIVAWMAFFPVTLNTLSSMATIGDHRFRIPTMTLSLVLQTIGLYVLLNKRKLSSLVNLANPHKYI